MYLNGQGVDQDNSKALEWYEKAATLGHAPSQYSLGYMYHQGVGVATDLVRATFWYQKAADQGNEEAKEILKEIQ
jgi:TPR repeat protein